jgi:Ca2+-transporting ATPase
MGVLALQVMVVHWQPAQMIFGTTDLHMDDWLYVTLVASSVLVLDELFKLSVKLAGLLKQGKNKVIE